MHRSASFLRRALPALGLTAMGLAASCSSPTANDGAGSADSNAICPMMGTEVDPQYTVVYEGRKVGFCCETCVEDWASMSEAERHEMLADLH